MLIRQQHFVVSSIKIENLLTNDRIKKKKNL